MDTPSIYNMLLEHQSPERARVVAGMLSEGHWTHDYPITLEKLKEMGLPVNASSLLFNLRCIAGPPWLTACARHSSEMCSIVGSTLPAGSERIAQNMSPKLPRITAQELLRALQRDGWIVDRQQGSHIRLWHPRKESLVTVAYHSSKTLKPKTLATILKQAEWSIEDLRRLL